jgi:outer membrane protein OmpA-like peptidoglycan-associated protein
VSIVAKNDETIDMVDSTPSKKPINKWVIISVVLALLVVGGLSVNAVLNKNKDSASSETVKTTDKAIAASSTKDTTPITPAIKTTDTSTSTAVLVEEPIKDVFQFVFDDYSLSQSEMSKIQSYWSKIQGKEGSVDIIGYSDNVGAEVYNISLSQKRAQAVSEALTKAGMGEKFKVTSNGLGIANPISDNSTEEGRTKNRRVEIIFKIIK